MKRLKILSLFVAITLLVCNFSITVFGEWDGECDISWYDINQSEFHIGNLSELMGLRRLVNSGETDFYDKTVYLDNDIDMDGVIWKVGIGYVESGNTAGGEVAFNGTFDGNGYLVKNFSYNSNAQADTDPEIDMPPAAKHLYHGLFGIIGARGIVCNLGIDTAIIEAGTKEINLSGLAAGAIAGSNKGTIKSCFLKSIKLKGGYFGSWCTHYYAGAAGKNTGKIQNCFLNGLDFMEVVAQINSSFKGGISASNAGNVRDCYTYSLVYDKSNGYYTWNPDGTGKLQITKMLYYDPIVCGKGTGVENVYSDDTYYKNSHTDPRTYTTFQEMTPAMKAKMQSLCFDYICPTEIDTQNSYPANGDVMVWVSPQIQLKFTQELFSSADNDSVVIKDSAGNMVLISGVYPMEYLCELVLGGALKWDAEYSISIENLTDMWGRKVVPAKITFTTTPEVSCESFKLYKNYPAAPVEITDLSSVTGKVTAVIKKLKNNSESNFFNAVMCIGYMEEGKLEKGNFKIVSIASQSELSEDVVLELDCSGISAPSGARLEAVLYKAFGNVVPLLPSALINK